MEAGKSPEELQDSYVTVLVARHFEAMWVHMRQGLDAMPAPYQRLMDQVAFLHHFEGLQFPLYCPAISCWRRLSYNY